MRRTSTTSPWASGIGSALRRVPCPSNANAAAPVQTAGDDLLIADLVAFKRRHWQVDIVEPVAQLYSYITRFAHAN